MQVASRIMITVWLSWMILVNFVRYIRLEARHKALEFGPEKTSVNAQLDRLAAVCAIDLGINAILLIFLWMFL